MTITVELLAGTWENFDDTMRAWLYRNWDDSKTQGITPLIMSPVGTNGDDAAHANTKANSPNSFLLHTNKDFISIEQHDQRRQDPETQGNKHTRKITVLVINIYGQTRNRAQLFANHINDIIHENMPNQNTRIKKSNNTENSAIATFDRQQIEWLQPREFADTGIRNQLTGEIGCVWQTTKT